MCKHVAAVLYGVGARLDQQPELIFTLRGVDARDLVTQAGAGLPTAKQRPPAGKVLDNSLLADVFGIEMADVAPMTKPTARRGKAAASKPTVATTGRAPAAKSPNVISKSKAKTKAPIQVPALTAVGQGKWAVRKVTADDAIVETVKIRRKSTVKTKQRVSG